MRQTFAHTVASAQQHYNDSGQTRSVNPWISLGAGYHPTAKLKTPAVLGWGFFLPARAGSHVLLRVSARALPSVTTAPPLNRD